MDAASNAYVVGTTSSSDFPTSAGAYQTSLHGDTDTFVAKLNATGDALLYSTCDGTAATNTGTAIAVNDLGDAYFTGSRYDAGTGLNDLVVTELNSGGTAQDYAYVLTSATGSTSSQGIAIDSSGNAYVTGVTGDASFPATSGVVQSTLPGTTAAFVLKLNTVGALSYATYLGGTGNSSGTAIAVAQSGAVYVTGSTTATNFPTSTGALQTSSGGGSDAFVAELSPTATTLLYSTYLGGSGHG